MNWESITSVGTLFSGIAALLAIIFVWWQIVLLKRQIFASLCIELNREFFMIYKSNKEIIRAIEREKPFIISSDSRKRKKGVKRFEPEDVDDYLGVMELLNILRERKLLDTKFIDNMFGHYISKAWNHRKIRKYINKLRESHNADTEEAFGGTQELVEEIERLDKQEDELENNQKKWGRLRGTTYYRIISSAKRAKQLIYT